MCPTEHRTENQRVLGYTLTAELCGPHARLIQLAAELVRGTYVPDTEGILRCKTTPLADRRRVSKALDGIDDRLRNLALELRKVADSLPKTEPVRMRDMVPQL